MRNSKLRSVVGTFILAGLIGLVSGQGCPMVAPQDDPVEIQTEDPTQDPTVDPPGEGTEDPIEEPTQEPTEESGLTDTQKQAVGIVTIELEALGKALAGFIDLVNPRVTTAETSTYETFGTCPLVTAALTESQTGVIVLFDYGVGCSSPLHGGAILAGTFNAGITFPVEPISSVKTLSLVIPAGFTIEGNAVVGSAQLSPVPDTGAGSGFEGMIGFTTENVGQATGAAQIAFDLSSLLVTVVDASLTLSDTTDITATPESNTFDVVVTNLVFNPGNDGNYIPQAGTVSFDVTAAETHSLVVTFTEQSRASRTVRVAVDGAEAVDYQIPG